MVRRSAQSLQVPQRSAGSHHRPSNTFHHMSKINTSVLAPVLRGKTTSVLLRAHFLPGKDNKGKISREHERTKHERDVGTVLPGPSRKVLVDQAAPKVKCWKLSRFRGATAGLGWPQVFCWSLPRSYPKGCKRSYFCNLYRKTQRNQADLAKIEAKARNRIT